MPNIAKILKDEIQRLARKEVAQAITVLRKSNLSLKKTLTEHKRRIAVLEQANKKLTAQRIAPRQYSPQDLPAPGLESQRITGKTIKSLRSRLKITQSELAKLVGVSINIVTIWENKPGRIRIRKSNVVKALLDLKGLTKGTVQARLGKKPAVSKKTATTKPRGRKAGKKISTSKISAGDVKKFRKKADISQTAFAKLAGVSYQVVSVWENKPGKLSFREKKTEEALTAIMKMTKKEVLNRLRRKK